MIAIPKKNSGFSLVELAILLTVVGLLFSTISSSYRSYLRIKAANDTGLRRDLVRAALSNFVSNYDRFPCPADPSLAPDQAGAGEEMCLGDNTQPFYIPLVTLSTCVHWDGSAGAGVCRTPSQRATPANPSWPNLLVKDPVLIGAIPYVALGIGVNDITDGWGNRFTYAVSEFMTDATKYNSSYGVISSNKRDPNTGTFAPEQINGVSHSFLFTVVSHGPDGKGAFTSSGKMGVACSSSAGIDNENCDNDSLFINADRTTKIYSTAPGANFFDDNFTLRDISTGSDKWAYDTAGKMYNKVLNGDVGIGTKTPQYKLDVEGQIKASAVLANSMCSVATTSPVKPANCFSATIVGGTPGGTAMGCAGSGVVTGIESSSANCADQLNVTSVATGDCPAGTFMKGLDSSGGLICEP